MAATVTLTEHAFALGTAAPAEAVFDTFSDWVAREKGFELYPAQVDAVLALTMSDNVILATPTGTGKSTVALGAHFYALTAGKRSIYTAPIKALVSEKFFELLDTFGAENVGMVTGDFTINPDAPIVCATAEILAQYTLSDPAARGFEMIIMDEFHYYADKDRGWAWQVPLLEATNAQFLLMSATLGDVSQVVATLAETTGRETTEITGIERPVPLSFRYAVKQVHEIVADIVHDKEAPVYLVHFNQNEATERAQALTSVNLLSKDEKAEIAQALKGFKFTPGFGQTLKKLLLLGIGVHHAGLLPKYRRLVEQLAQQGHLKVICGTDTLGIGINVPIRTVLITSLVKFDGVKERRLTAREFHQIAGRAGRAGYDTEGDVVVAAPEHEVANKQALAKFEAKQLQNPQKKLKPPKKTAPKAGVTWSEASFERLVSAEVEALTSRLQITNSMLLAYAVRGESKPGTLISGMRALIQRSHEPATKKFELQRHTLKLLRSLLAAGVLETTPVTGGKLLGLAAGTGASVALNSPLALFGIAALELLDMEADSYTLDAISVIEATLESPRQVLVAQERKAKSELIAELKADGVDYYERQDQLEQVTHPEPLAELIDAAFEQYVAHTPWVRGAEPQAKSIVRDMLEKAFSFRDFITYYGLQRAEGVVLRYLTDAYRTLSRGVPAAKRNEQLNDYITWLGTLVRQVDSSLLDEWEQLVGLGLQITETSSGAADELQPPTEQLADTLTGNQRAFELMVRNAMFRLVLLADQENTQALVAASSPAVAGSDLQPNDSLRAMTANDWDDALDDYFDEYSDIGVGQEARNKAMLKITKQPAQWLLEQVVLDPKQDLSWAIYAVCDVALSNELGEPAITVTAFRER